MADTYQYIVNRSHDFITLIDRDYRYAIVNDAYCRAIEHPREQILDHIKGGDYHVTFRSIDFHILRLRKKLGHASRHIETVRGVGYRFREKEEQI